MARSAIERHYQQARLRLLQLHYDSGTGHIGGNLSCLHALMVLHHIILREEDRFLLSKGHAAGALYVTLWSLGKLTDQDLLAYGKDDTHLPLHPCGRALPGLLFPTGSLGHGPSLAAGLALAARHQNLDRQIYCLCSDGEWQEGSCWEALSFAVHNRLDNLTLIIDQNRWQGFGSTMEVISCADLSPRLASFGVMLTRAPGHDLVAIEQALEQRSSGVPRLVVLDTVKGHGTHFENQLKSHYLPLNEEQYQLAREQGMAQS